MTVTFQMQDTPTVRVCPFPEQDPDFWVDEPAAPFFDVNVSNHNAAALLALIDPDDLGDCAVDFIAGKWPVSSLPSIIRNCMRIACKPELGVEASYQDGNIFNCGRGEDYVSTRVGQIMDLCRLAQENNKPVTFC